jgi:effector-binding domain-containing protein
VDDVPEARVLTAPDEEARNAVMVLHLDRMSRPLEQVQHTLDSLRRMLAGKEEEIGSPTATSPPGSCWRSADASTATRPCRGGSRHSPSCTGCSRPQGTRTGPDGAEFPTEFFTERAAEQVAFVPVDRVPSLGGRVGAVTRPAVRYAVAVHDGPMVDLDGAYAAVGQTVRTRALSSEGPVVERYLPLGDEDDLLAHTAEVCWPVED